MSRRSGTLQLATTSQQGEIVFRLGKVVAGFRSDIPESIGTTLVRANVMTPQQLQDMLVAQNAGTLGPALFEAFGLRGEALDNALEEALKLLVYGMFEWKDGTFSFVLNEQPDPWQNFGLDRARAVADRGLNPQYLAIEGARLRDEHSKEDPADAFAALSQAAMEAASTTQSSASAASPKGTDEDWSQVHMETAAPILPEVRVQAKAPVAPAPAAPAASASGDIIPFPAGGRGRRDVAARAPQPEGMQEPVAEGALATATVPEVALNPEPTPSTVHEGARSTHTLLVVDDDAQVLQQIRDALHTRFVQVVTCSSVIEAQRFLEASPPNLVVASDLIIARSDGTGILGGVELLELVRKRWPTMPMVLFSDYQNEEADQRIRELTVLAQLVKPRKAQIYADGKRGGVTPPMRDFLSRLEGALTPFMAGGTNAAAPAAPAPPPAPAPAPAPQQELVGQRVNGPPPTMTMTPPDDLNYDLRSELAAALEESELGQMELPPAVASSAEMGALRSMVMEMRDPSNTDAVSLLILRFASGLFERAALFLPTRRAYVGLGGFSVNEESEQYVQRVRQLQVPVDLESMFTQVVHFRTLIRSPLADTEGNRCLMSGLGGAWHRGDAVAVPLISGDRIAAILFGDNPSGKPIGSTDGLEIFLQQAGLVMERALLERKLEESRRRDRPSR